MPLSSDWRPAVRFLLCAFALAVACGRAHPQDRDAPPARQAATIELVAGDAIIDPKAGAARLAKTSESVNEGDTITTFAGAEVHLRMADAAHLSIRENSKLTITTYRADGGDDDNSLLDLAKGSIRAITGWIGRFNRRNYAIRTPTVTIGVRGTDHEPMHLLQGDSRGAPGTYDKVNEGSTSMKSERGTVEVTPNRAAFHGSTPGARPQLLQTVPAFFRPARNEPQFVQRARETAPRIEKLRDTRVQAVKTERQQMPRSTPAPTPPRAVPMTSARPAQAHKAPVAAPVKPAAKAAAQAASPRVDQKIAEKRPAAAMKTPVNREAAKKPVATAPRTPPASRAPYDAGTKARPAEKKRP